MSLRAQGTRIAYEKRTGIHPSAIPVETRSISDIRLRANAAALVGRRAHIAIVPRHESPRYSQRIRAPVCDRTAFRSMQSRLIPGIVMHALQDVNLPTVRPVGS